MPFLFTFKYILVLDISKNSVAEAYIVLHESLTEKVNKKKIFSLIVPAEKTDTSFWQKKHSFPKTAYKYFTQLPNFLKV